MNPFFRWRYFAWAALALIAVICIWLIRPSLNVPSSAIGSDSSSELRPHMDGKLLVLPTATTSVAQLQTETIRPIREPQTLRLTGQLMLDPSKLVHVTSRFSGEVVSVAESTLDSSWPLRVGDHVKKGQVLAVIWSKEIGEKKSDLVDALSQLYLHEAVYRNLKNLEKSGAVPQRNIDEMQRNYESDLIQVERIRRTLKSWRVTAAELEKIETEAKRIHSRAMIVPNGKPATSEPSQVDSSWAEIEIVAPMDGTILEKNVTVGDIVTTSLELFKIADLNRVIVMANIYEEDLVTLLRLPADQRNWRIALPSNPGAKPVAGRIDVIGEVIDPNQHTAILQGSIDNSNDELRVGQFIEAMLDLPTHAKALEVPIRALIEQGAKQWILVSRSDDMTRWERVPVNVLRRTSQVAWVEASSDATIGDGDRVLIRGALELASVVEDLQTL